MSSSLASHLRHCRKFYHKTFPKLTSVLVALAVSIIPHFQIGRFNRAAGPTGRFRLQLINKCVKAETSYKDSSVSPVIR